MRKTKFIYS